MRIMNKFLFEGTMKRYDDFTYGYVDSKTIIRRKTRKYTLTKITISIKRLLFSSFTRNIFTLKYHASHLIKWIKTIWFSIKFHGIHTLYHTHRPNSNRSDRWGKREIARHLEEIIFYTVAIAMLCLRWLRFVGKQLLSYGKTIFLMLISLSIYTISIRHCLSFAC